MRRSNSLSSIPLPTMRRESRTRERGLSVARYSRERSIDAATPLLSHNRLLPPGSNKFSAQKHLLWTPSGTPTFSGGYKRSNPLSSCGSTRGSILSLCKSPAAERKNFQKHLSDKKWLAEKYSKIQDYICTSGLFDASLAESLRPPTIAIFVQLITKLLDQIIETGPVNTTNYGDIVITNLKLLRYPGQITNSVVKTINTLHAWPHFIAIISFLLDKANLNTVEMESKFRLDEENKMELDLQDSALSFLFTAMASPNSVEMGSEIKTLIGVDFEAVQKLEETEAKEQQEHQELENKLKEKKQIADELKAKNQEMQQLIDQYENNKGNREKEVKEEVETLKNKVTCLKVKIDELHLSKKNLENVLSKQNYTFEQKEEMLNKIEELKRLIERRQMNAAKLRQQHVEMDEKIVNAVMEIERKVDQWNVAIKQTLLPELRDLKLREKGFHEAEFLEEILEIEKKKINLERKLVNEYKEKELKIEKLQKLKESMANDNQNLSSARKEVDNLRQKLNNLEEKKQTMMSDFSTFSIDHDLKVKKFLEMRQAEMKEHDIISQSLISKIQKQIEKTDETKKRGSAGMIQAYNAVMKDFQEIHDIKHRMLKEVRDAHKMSTRQTQEMLEHLVQLQENTAKLYGSLEDKENME